MLCNPIRGSSIARSIQRLSRPSQSFKLDNKTFVYLQVRSFCVTMSNSAENRSYSVSIGSLGSAIART